METKFIEGTNQQYSIREDGVVISHHRNNGRGGISYKNKEMVSKTNKYVVHLRINNKNISYSIRKLLIKYHNNVKCKLCNNIITNYKEFICRECDKAQHRKDSKKNTARLTPSYIASLLRIKVKDLSEELYLHHKNQILLRRQLCKNHNISINTINGYLHKT
jgi:hypothetical protein